MVEPLYEKIGQLIREPLDIEALDPQTRLIVAIDKIEALGMQLASDRDEMQARLSAAALFARLAVASAQAALVSYDGTQSRQRHYVHDSVVEALAHLRTVQSVLAGTPPETREAPSQRRIRRH